MQSLLIILFAFSLVWVVVTERLRTLNRLVALQGVLLFGISLLSLRHIDALHLGFILLETLLIKVLAVPVFFEQLLKRHTYKGAINPQVRSFVSLLIISATILGCFLLSSTQLSNPLMIKFLTAGTAALFTGLYIILIHRQVLVHLMGYLVLENGIFLLSISVGDESPMLVSGAILLDVFSTVLALGLFANKIGTVYEDFHIDHLQELKD